jgi:hypothetical protein
VEPGLKEQLAHRELLDFKVPQVQLAGPVFKELQVCKGLLGYKELLVRKVLREFKDVKVQ